MSPILCCGYSEVNRYTEAALHIGVYGKKFSENMQQIFRRKPMLKCEFSKLQSNFEGSPISLLHISEQLSLRIPMEGCFSLIST